MYVGIMTHYHNNNNYGGLLQAYALQKVISSLGIKVEIIDYVHEIDDKKRNSFFEKIKRYLKKSPIGTVKLILKTIFSKIRKKIFMLKKENREYYELLLNRSKCEKFRNSIPHSKLYDIDTLGNSIVDYDAFIVGSDQVWHPGYVTQYELLKFVPDSKIKISYAASMGSYYLDKYSEKLFRENLSRLDYISVREKETINVLNKFVDKSIQWVLDPVFLLDNREWSEINLKKNDDNKYIFAYLLGTSLKNRRLLKHVQYKTKLPVVYMPLIENISDFRQYKTNFINIFNVSPNSFLSYIKNAELIITDSFHCMVFAIIFNKQFIILERDSKKSQWNTNSRLLNILKMFDLDKRMIYSQKMLDIILNEKVQYENVNKLISKYKEQSLQYLKTALGVK